MSMHADMTVPCVHEWFWCCIGIKGLCCLSVLGPVCMRAVLPWACCQACCGSSSPASCTAPQVMELENRLQKAGSDIARLQEEARLAVASAAAGAAAAGVSGDGMGAPAAAAATANGGTAEVMSAMMRKGMGMVQSIQQQAPGYARMLSGLTAGAADGAVRAADAAAAEALSGPEHVPQAAGRPPAQESEAERRTRELQVGARERRHSHCDRIL